MKVYVARLGGLDVPDSKSMERARPASSTSHSASQAHQSRNSYGPEPSRSARGAQGAHDDEPAARRGATRSVRGDALQQGSEQVGANLGIGALQEQQSAVAQIGALVDQARVLASGATPANPPPYPGASTDATPRAERLRGLVSAIDARAKAAGLGSDPAAGGTPSPLVAADAAALGLDAASLAKAQARGAPEVLRTVEGAREQLARVGAHLAEQLRAYGGASHDPARAEQAAKSAAEATRRQPDAASAAQANVTAGDVAALLA